VAILECSGCRDRIVVVEDELVGGRVGGTSGPVTWRGLHWWPTPGSGSLSADIPPSVRAAYAEGMRCLSAGAPNGAVAMFRTAMTFVVEDKGTAAAQAKGDLKEKVRQMVVDGSVPATLGDWIDHVRLYGNAGVHPDLFGDVSLDEALDVSRLVLTLFDVLYVLPGNIARRQAERRRS
jgi:hypothetical protein